jgi:hypothetical protein
MLIEEEFTAFVVRWSVIYYCKPVEEEVWDQIWLVK